ncbi:suppressor of tumorigenicity 14 protein homolog [Haliotis rufescens]|uniref:suppressor of tumorigenicity 14 protein homolog n=1 Tax=Haliotis rufescens TaxID=6454 RepID=UPI00201EB634|nr:suppressor of tumorigenicity 14 protein homolog [Haliotis rufescens]
MVFLASSLDFTFVVIVIAFINAVKGDIDQTLTATKEAKFLTSPGYPLGYQNNLKCKWEIVGPPNSKLKVKILSSDIGRQVTCEGDYVQVLDGSTTNTFCYFETPSYTSSGSTITIRFISDGSGTSKGFRLQYYYIDSQTDNSLMYGILIMVGVVVFFVLLYTTSTKCSRKSPERRSQLETRHQNQHAEMQTVTVAPNTNNTELFAPPPTYNDNVNSNNMSNNKDNVNDTSPPPYSSLRISDTIVHIHGSARSEETQ